MNVLPFIVCCFKGHRLDYAYYLDARPCDFGFMHYGLVATCSRCEEMLELDEDTDLPILEPPRALRAV